MKNLLLAAAGMALLAAQTSAAQSPAPQANPWFPDLAVTQLRTDQVQALKAVSGLVGGCLSQGIGELLSMSDQVREHLYEEGRVRQAYATYRCPVITQAIEPNSPNPDLEKMIDGATPACHAVYTGQIVAISHVAAFNDDAGRVKADLQSCVAQMTLATTNTCNDLRHDFANVPSPSSASSVAADIFSPFAGATAAYSEDQMRTAIRRKMTALGCPDIP
ncbi:hypothetical protein [Phenylobacterium soli]|uniref:Uncharacterized protein n=1 Tax=Phenylobacterium soli TaxID=2170551 RepID=A0A328ASQ0_9CAUL|nr:hypothetical protein [Phenylobacterium soli]RAK55948.1 hypothetical protein DJ017_16245 [Phenylobacterium soli]